ncbi:hypothetical protein ACRJ4W_06910 [Streptomyces sp. GLT-R25]
MISCTKRRSGCSSPRGSRRRPWTRSPTPPTSPGPPSFNHYSQKVGFLEEWGVRRRASVAAILGQEHAEVLPVGERLRRYLREMAELNVASRGETTVLMSASARFGRLFQDPSLEIELTKIVEEGKQRGEIRPEADSDQAGALLAACYFTTVLRWIREEPPPFDLPDSLNAALDIVLTGILTPA